MFQERARIARELHDSVSQTLYAITLTASRARLLLDQNDLQHIEVLEILGDVVELADTGQSELRSLLANIGSNLLTSGGLINALAKLAGDFRVRGDVVGLDIRLSLIDEPDVPAATKEGLVLIAREALQNVVRHSGADRVDIVLETDAESLVLRIADNGHGFQPTSQWPGHFGLQSMRDRASAIEGVLTLVSGEAIGTQVRVCVPRVRGQSWMNSTG